MKKMKKKDILFVQQVEYVPVSVPVYAFFN